MKIKLLFLLTFFLLLNSKVYSKCNWIQRNAQFTTWDSCSTQNKKASLNGYISFGNNTNCLKYQWTINGTPVGNSLIMNKKITQDGSYNICVKVTDSCNQCDTTYCINKNIKCFNDCKFYNQAPYFQTWDSCVSRSGRKSVNGYIMFNTNPCFLYEWTVNNQVVSNELIMSHTITQNGKYNICVKVTDTCKGCDTTFCNSILINCFSSCSFSKQFPSFNTWDSCNSNTGRKSVNGYIVFNTNPCLDYEWSVNNQVVGNGIIMSHTITKNGKYDICVKVTDTCRKCDTLFCNLMTVNCSSLGLIQNQFNNYKIYPNPSNHILNIEGLGNTDYFEIIDLTGKSILISSAVSIDISNIKTGLYFVKFFNSNHIEIHREKLIILTRD